MSITPINIGTAPNDGTGDNLRAAFAKVNANTQEQQAGLALKANQTALDAGLALKEPAFAAGTAAQYWRGDKTWRTLDKAAVGLANVDNTSDANKPVSAAQAAAIAARYGRNNILGGVSQSAGVPAGALIEQGSNSNGRYLRFADGTQICTISSSFTSNADVVWTYPAVFAAAPNYLSASANHPSDPRYYDVDAAITSGNVSATIYRSLRGTARTPVADPFVVCAIAVGRWF